MSKFFTTGAGACLHCRSGLIDVDLGQNASHLYSVGILYACPCGQSALWTNSVRRVYTLEDAKLFLSRISQPGGYWPGGYCNDLFCGVCLTNADVLKTGIDFTGRRQRGDVLGCLDPECSTQVAYWRSGFSAENDPSDLAAVYLREARTLLSMFAEEGQ